MPLVMDLSTAGTVVTYVNLVNQTTPIIINAPGKDEWLQLDQQDGGDMRLSCDGSLGPYVKPALASGTLTFLALSPALTNAFINTMQQQQELKIAILGTLTVASANGLWVNTYNNFQLTSAFVGYEIGEYLKDVPVKFKCALPNTSNASTLIAVGEAVTTII